MDYLMSTGDNINEFFFKKNQMPDRWFYKAYRLYQDANILYSAFEKERQLIIKKLKEEENFIRCNDSRVFKECMYDILEKNPEIHIPDFRSFYLLAGFSIENALKGIIVSQNIEIIGSRKLDSKLKEHNLNKLIKMIILELDNEQTEFLDRLGDLITSYGRYPTKATCSNNSKAYEHDFGDINHEEASFNCITNPYKQDKFLFEDIYDKLNLLMNEAKDKYNEHMNIIFSEEIIETF